MCEDDDVDVDDDDDDEKNYSFIYWRLIAQSTALVTSGL